MSILLILCLLVSCASPPPHLPLRLGALDGDMPRAAEVTTALTATNVFSLYQLDGQVQRFPSRDALRQALDSEAVHGAVVGDETALLLLREKYAGRLMADLQGVLVIVDASADAEVKERLAAVMFETEYYLRRQEPVPPPPIVELPLEPRVEVLEKRSRHARAVHLSEYIELDPLQRARARFKGYHDPSRMR